MKTQLRKYTVFWSLLTLVVTSACAAQRQSNADTHALVEQAAEMINNHEFKRAYEILKPLADAGNVEANDAIGDLYRIKSENNPYYDFEKAIKAYYFAANAGHAWAQIGLGQLLQHQVVVKAKSFRYDYNQPELKKYADKTYKESCAWFEKAARQGEGYAMLDVARCYEDGYVTNQKDYPKAYAWYALAAGKFEVEEGDTYSPNSMAESFMKRAAKRGNLNKEQIQQALDLAKTLRDEISSDKKDQAHYQR